MSLMVVDSSVWIDFFRGEPAAVLRVDPLLADGRAAVLGAVYAEVLSGTRNRGEYARLRELLGGLERVPDLASPWERVAEVRYALVRSGKQAAALDVLIALTVAERGAGLLTRDGDFERIRAVLPFELTVF